MKTTWLNKIFLVKTSLALIVGLGIFALLNKYIKFSQRAPAAQSRATSHEATPRISKKDILMRVDHHRNHTIKGSGPLSIEISETSAAPFDSLDSSETPLELEATITATAQLEDLEFEWILPEEVRGSTANLRGSVGTLSEGQSIQIRLSASSRARENSLIHLHVFRKVYGEAHGLMAQYQIGSKNDFRKPSSLKLHQHSQQKPLPAPSSEDRQRFFQ